MKINIYDCFMLHNELDLLEIRLNVLNEFVDYFVIIESGQTHAGYKKKFQFKLKNQNLDTIKTIKLHYY